jgi:hypothetical protein
LKFSFLTFLLFFVISISLLYFSSMLLLLTFLSRSSIDYLTSFICLFESSLRSLIIFNCMLLNFIRHFSQFIIFEFSCWVIVGVWRGNHCLGFSYLNFHSVICASVGLIFSVSPPPPP